MGLRRQRGLRGPMQSTWYRACAHTPTSLVDLSVAGRSDATRQRSRPRPGGNGLHFRDHCQLDATSARQGVSCPGAGELWCGGRSRRPRRALPGLFRQSGVHNPQDSPGASKIARMSLGSSRGQQVPQRSSYAAPAIPWPTVLASVGRRPVFALLELRISFGMVTDLMAPPRDAITERNRDSMTHRVAARVTPCVVRPVT